MRQTQAKSSSLHRNPEDKVVNDAFRTPNVLNASFTTSETGAKLRAFTFRPSGWASMLP